LNIADLKFNQETMLRLTSLQFAELKSKHETVISYAPAKDYRIDANFARLFLSYNGSLSSFFFEFEPTKEVDTFAHNSFLTHFFPKTGKVKLIDGLADPLANLLPKRPFDTSAMVAINKTSLLAQLGEQHVFDDKLDENAVSNLLSTGNFKGQVSCCECGVAGCSSEYLWAEDFFGLISFRILAAGLQVVKLYPFQIV
jgi:hypothetical protein